MPSSTQKFWNSAAVKFVPLSVMMLCGTPNLKMIDLMKLTGVSVVELVMGTASIHLVNLSTATRRCVLPPFDDFLSGPTMSSPQVANSQDSGIVLSSEAGACGLLGEFLAGNAASHDFLRIFHGCGPVEPGSEYFGHGHSTTRVVPAGAFVDSE